MRTPPQRTRAVVAATIILAAGGAIAACSRPTATPVMAEAGGAADASVNVDATADASADAETSVDAAADARPREGGDMSAGDGGAARSRIVKIDEGSAGKTIDLAPGQTLVALLTANPSTGFDWAVIKAPAALGGPEMGFVTGGEQPGAPGKRRIAWSIKSALPAGEHTVELGYARSFEKGVAPFKTFEFKVRAAH